jgi:hypothetical protein
MWFLTDKNNKVIKGGVRFRAEKLDGAMVVWSPNSIEGSDFAANLLNLLERFSKEGSTNCALTTERKTTPQQEQRVATFQCGLRSIIVEHDRFQLTFKGQKLPDGSEILETNGTSGTTVFSACRRPLCQGHENIRPDWTESSAKWKLTRVLAEKS